MIKHAVSSHDWCVPKAETKRPALRRKKKREGNGAVSVKNPAFADIEYTTTE